jgi:uncharacterized cupredoxin-like copper-binding protein
VHRKVMLVVLVVSVLFVSASGFAATEKTSATAVRVSATEFRFTLSKKIVAKGTVAFTVVNRGTVAHDFKIAGRKTALIAPGKSRTLRVAFTKPGKYRYICTLPSHAVAGMKGVLTVR